MIGFDLVVFEGIRLLEHPVSHHVAAVQRWGGEGAFTHHDRNGFEMFPGVIRLIDEWSGHWSDGAPVFRILRAEVPGSAGAHRMSREEYRRAVDRIFVEYDLENVDHIFLAEFEGVFSLRCYSGPLFGSGF